MLSDWLQQISPCLRPVLAGEHAHSHTYHAETAPRWVEPLRVIYDHELMLFSKGCYRVDIAGREYDCPAHSYIIIPPGCWHTSWNISGQSGYRYWSHFDWAWQGPYHDTPIMTFAPAQPRERNYRLAPPPIPTQIQHGVIQSPERVYDLCMRMSTLFRFGSEHEKCLARALLLEILLELLDPSAREKRNPEHGMELAGRVRDLLEETVIHRRPIPPIQQLLETLGYSYAHLCRVFHARYGIPPLQYVHALQLGRAKQLLRDTDLTVSEIAYRVGFDDPNYFRQLFRRATGVPPSVYARTKSSSGTDAS